MTVVKEDVLVIAGVVPALPSWLNPLVGTPAELTDPVIGLDELGSKVDEALMKGMVAIDGPTETPTEAEAATPTDALAATAIEAPTDREARIPGLETSATVLTDLLDELGVGELTIEGIGDTLLRSELKLADAEAVADAAAGLLMDDALRTSPAETRVLLALLLAALTLFCKALDLLGKRPPDRRPPRRLLMKPPATLGAGESNEAETSRLALSASLRRTDGDAKKAGTETASTETAVTETPGTEAPGTEMPSTETAG